MFEAIMESLHKRKMEKLKRETERLKIRTKLEKARAGVEIEKAKINALKAQTKGDTAIGSFLDRIDVEGIQDNLHNYSIEPTSEGRKGGEKIYG